MSRKEATPLPSFREIVSLRYKKDTIMNGFATAVTLLMPMAVLGFVLFLANIGIGDFGGLKDYQYLIVQVSIYIQMFVIMAILFQMYRRLGTHAQRDKLWRQSLIQFANRMGADTVGLCELDRRIARREHFLLTPVIIALMAAMFVYCVILFVYYTPRWAFTDDTVYLEDPMYIGIILCLIQLALIFFKILTYAYKHEKRQCEFTLELSKCLSQVGVAVPPMIRIVSHHNILFHIILLIFTFGLYIIWLGFQLFKGMNQHLMNQWVFENEMLRVIESDGNEVFTTYMPDYFADSRMDSKRFKRLNTLNFVQVKHTVKSMNKMPPSLILAEIFLIAICANYILKIIALDCEISSLYGVFEPLFEGPQEFIDGIQTLDTKQLTDLVMIPVDLVMLMITISAMLGIASRKPTSWRKVTRSCITFVLPLWVSFFGLTNNSGLTHIFEFKTELGLIATTIILTVVFCMMILSSSIKEFYTPLDDEPPGLLTWLRFVFFGKLDAKDADVDVDLDD